MRPALLAALALLLASCNPSKTAFQLGMPGTRTEMTVARVKARGGFLDTELHGPGFTLRTFVPANETCLRVTAREATIQFSSDSAYGTLVRGEDHCVASGIGSLREWRNRRPRQTNRVIPSALANYTLIFQDEEVSFLRGSFPLVGLLGFTGMGDSIAVVPNDPLCRRAIESDSSTMEYFHGGKNVLTLSSSEGRCNIVGLIRPLSVGDADS